MNSSEEKTLASVTAWILDPVVWFIWIIWVYFCPFSTDPVGERRARHFFSHYCTLLKHLGSQLPLLSQSPPVKTWFNAMQKKSMGGWGGVLLGPMGWVEGSARYPSSLALLCLNTNVAICSHMRVLYFLWKLANFVPNWNYRKAASPRRANETQNLTQYNAKR